MATRQDRPLEDEQTYFIRGMYILEVSVAVLRDAVKRSKVNLVEWWEKHTKTLKMNKRDPKEELKPWQVQSIATDSWEKWDISVLSYAIRNCEDFLIEEHEDLRECAKKLNDMRSDCLCHELRARIAFDKYIRILQTSMKCYKRLIAEREAYMEYVKQLEDITKYHIRDQEIENWMKLLKSRDERMRHGLREEELRVIHADLVAKVKESMEEMKQNVTVEQQQQQVQQQNMQATNMPSVTLVQNLYGTEAQAKIPKAGAYTSLDDTNTMPKEEIEFLGRTPTLQVNPISQLNEYSQKLYVEQPRYVEEMLGQNDFLCRVTFQGKTLEGKSRKSKSDAKRAAAQMVIDSLKS